MTNNFLYWKFDVNTFKLIGRELITDRITALFELVKNCYDANAENVFVEFNEVSSLSSRSKIIIHDDGEGMTLNDIKNKWMVVGTDSKRKKIYSNTPYKRRYIGEKGIGRFAVDKLGGMLHIRTKTEKDEKELNIIINWNYYETLAEDDKLRLCTDIENKFYYSEDLPTYKQGTTLEISYVRDYWTKQDIDRAYKELSKIISPYHSINPPFNIFLKSTSDLDNFNNRPIKSSKIKYASLEFDIDFNLKEDKQEELVFNQKKERIEIKKSPIYNFGPVKIKFFHFNEKAKRDFNKAYGKQGYVIDGIKIFRDGIITTPFAENEANREKKRDILGIDKRLWHGAFDKISNNEIMGIVDITKEFNPKIVESTNRQDFIDNHEYRGLKEFIIHQINELENYKLFLREQKKEELETKLDFAVTDVKDFQKKLDSLTRKNPKLKDAIEPIKSQAKELHSILKEGIKQQTEEKKEFVRKENIYLSLMSLQEYAIHIAHAVRTKLGAIKQYAEFFKNEFPNTKYEGLFIEYALQMYQEMERLNNVISFMLSYAKSNISIEEFDLKVLISNLFMDTYKTRFNAEGIGVKIHIEGNIIITGNKKFFEDIFENLIANSIKALNNTNNKIIDVRGEVIGTAFTCFISDNGCGIEKDIKGKIFDMFFTTTAEEGGAGLGLFIVKTRIKALNGTIEVIDNLLKPKGASFKITIPFKSIHND